MQEADTDDNQGALGFEEFCSFYKMMSTRRDLYLLMLTYSNHKDHLNTDDLARFLETEQKVRVFVSASWFLLRSTWKSYATVSSDSGWTGCCLFSSSFLFLHCPQCNIFPYF